MEPLPVKIIKLEPMRVISFLGYGDSPEMLAHQALADWAQAHGLKELPGDRRVFGFNNPNPSEGSPNYGYELWLTVEPGDAPAEGERVLDFEGGLYAVTPCKGVFVIFQTWQELVKWVETSPYRPSHHQCLEEHLRFVNVPLEEYEFDLYLPVD